MVGVWEGVVGSRGWWESRGGGVEGGWGLRGRSGWVRSPGVVGSRVVGV